MADEGKSAYASLVDAIVKALWGALAFVAGRMSRLSEEEKEALNEKIRQAQFDTEVLRRRADDAERDRLRGTFWDRNQKSD